MQPNTYQGKNNIKTFFTLFKFSATFLTISIIAGTLEFAYAQKPTPPPSKPSSQSTAKPAQKGAPVSTANKSTRKITRDADELFIDQMFSSALPIYLQLDEIKPQNAEINYKIGICYLHTEEKGKSIQYFLKSQQYDKKNEFEDINYYIGVAYHYGLEFDRAIESYEKYKLLLKPNQQFSKEMIRLVNKFIANCYTAKVLIKSPLKVSIQNLGLKVNSGSRESYPVISPDEKTLYFSSSRIDLSGMKPGEEPEDVFEDIYVCNRDQRGWGAAQKVGSGLNTFKNDAPLSLSPDGKKLFFYRTDKNNSTDIYYIDYKNNAWSDPTPMPGKINSPSWETGASITADGKLFYFSSDRAGGYGGMDIYFCRWDEQTGWSDPKNLGPEINSEWDEEAPHIMPDGKTLYFSNNGPNAIGGLDIFKTQFNSSDSIWAVPKNLGYPINSPEHEVHISWVAEGNKGYFANARSDSYGDEDIYSIQFQDPEPAKPLFIVSKDSILNKKFKAPKTGDVFPQRVYFDFNIAGDYAEFSHPKLLEVVEYLEKYPEVRIEIGGHADNQGDPDVNWVVSNKRALTVYNYFISKGVDPSRLVTKAYSNTKLLYNGKSTIENAINRRVEFTVLQGVTAKN